MNVKDMLLRREGSHARSRHLCWLGQVAALKAPTKMLQLHRRFRGLLILQSLIQAPLRGSRAAHDSKEWSATMSRLHMHHSGSMRGAYQGPGGYACPLMFTRNDNGGLLRA